MTFLRGWWAAVLLAPVAILADGSASAEGPRLPHGIHVMTNGRYVQDVCDRGAHRHCFASRLLPEGYRPEATPAAPAGFCTSQGAAGGANAPPTGSMGPTEVAKAYALPASASAGGRIVALVDMPDTTAFADVTAYRAAYGLPVLPKCTGGLPDGKTPCFAAVNQSGVATTNVTDCPAADPETSLDMDMISAACPDCSILLVQMTAADQTNGPSDADFVTSVASAAKLGAVATSISFGGGEGGTAGGDPTGYTTPGHLVLAASGDSGYLLEGIPQNQGGGTSPSYPGSAPDVLGVGGTILQGGSGNTFSETVWNDQSGAGGSGCSTEYPMPAFQTAFGATKFGACTMRASVDIAAAANFNPAGGGQAAGGIAEYDSVNKWIQVVGTSASAPLVGAILVRLGVADAISSDFGLLYKNLGVFNDVTGGTNDGFNGTTLCTAGDVICTAKAGWDGPTGVGTPNGAKILALGLNDNDGGLPVDAGNDTGATEQDSGQGDDAGSLFDSGATTLVGDGGNAFGGGSVSTGCGCATPGSTSPLESTGALVALGALGLVAARRRRR